MLGIVPALGAADGAPSVGAPGMSSTFVAEADGASIFDAALASLVSPSVPSRDAREQPPASTAAEAVDEIAAPPWLIAETSLFVLEPAATDPSTPPSAAFDGAVEDEVADSANDRETDSVTAAGWQGVPDVAVRGIVGMLADRVPQGPDAREDQVDSGIERQLGDQRPQSGLGARDASMGPETRATPYGERESGDAVAPDALTSQPSPARVPLLAADASPTRDIDAQPAGFVALSGDDGRMSTDVAVGGSTSIESPAIAIVNEYEQSPEAGDRASALRHHPEAFPSSARSTDDATDVVRRLPRMVTMDAGHTADTAAPEYQIAVAGPSAETVKSSGGGLCVAAYRRNAAPDMPFVGSKGLETTTARADAASTAIVSPDMVVAGAAVDDAGRQDDGQEAGRPPQTLSDLVRQVQRPGAPDVTTAFASLLPVSPAAVVTTRAALPGSAPAAAELIAASAENVERLVQAMRVSGRGGAWEAVVQIRPEHLGPVTIAVRVEGSTVSATVNAESDGVRQWLEVQRDEVRSRLSEHGLELDRFEVRRDRDEHADERDREQPRPQPRRQIVRPGEEPLRFEVTV